jgi:hypothetical protein
MSPNKNSEILSMGSKMRSDSMVSFAGISTARSLSLARHAGFNAAVSPRESSCVDDGMQDAGQLGFGRYLWKPWEIRTKWLWPLISVQFLPPGGVEHH